jgi:splicing factor, arginine/serine-rich 16
MLEIHGRAAKVRRNTEEYENIEHMKVMMPWNGDSENLIDRFDARAQLDMWREPKSRAKLSESEREVEEV